MKFYSLQIFVFALIMSLTFVCSNNWIDTFIEFNSDINLNISKIRVLYYKEILQSNIKSLINIVEKDLSTSNSLENKTLKGLFAKDDLLVISKRYLYWFSKTDKLTGRKVRTAGGLLAGLWELVYDKNSNNIFFKNYDSKNNFAPSLLLTGSSRNNKLFGQDIFGGYFGTNKKIIWGLEFSKNVNSTKKTGRDILSIDKGPYSSDDGVFVQFKGIVGNSPLIGDGIESLTDTDPRKGVEGETHFTLNYRIPSDRLEFITEIEFHAVKNNFGPISNAYISMYLPGYEPNDMVYASSPELMPKLNYKKDKKNESHLKNVEINKYFRNSSVKKSYFYDVFANKRSEGKMTAQTPPGRGRIICLGGPLNKIGFFCGYPNNDYIPKDSYEEYILELNDNKNSAEIGKFHSLNYKLLSTPFKTVTINQGEKLIMVMRYKLINASVPLPQKNRGLKFKKVK